MFEKCEFCEKWDFEIVNFVKKWDFEIVNFVKKEILKLWILWKVWFSNCEFCETRLTVPSAPLGSAFGGGTLKLSKAYFQMIFGQKVLKKNFKKKSGKKFEIFFFFDFSEIFFRRNLPYEV